MHFPVALWMIVMTPGGTPVVTPLGTFGNYILCKQAAESAQYHAKQGILASVGFLCVERPS